MRQRNLELHLIHSRHFHLAAYRAHTGALLRRFVRLSTGVARTPGTLRVQEAQARISSYRLRTFEDAIIFVHDVERCLRQLDADSLEALAAFALLGLERREAAAAMRLSLTQAQRRYAAALDRLTRELLRAGLMSRRFGEDEFDDDLSKQSGSALRCPLPSAASQFPLPPRKPPARATPGIIHPAMPVSRR